MTVEAKVISDENSTDKERQKLKIKESSYSKQLEALSARLAELPINVSAKPIYEQMAKIEVLKTDVFEKLQKLQGEIKTKPAEFSDVVEFAKLVKDVLLSNNNPELKALVISKFVKKIEVGEDLVLVHYYVGQDHFKRELAHAGSSFNEITNSTENIFEKSLKDFGSNSLTNGGTTVTWPSFVIASSSHLPGHQKYLSLASRSLCLLEQADIFVQVLILAV